MQLSGLSRGYQFVVLSLKMGWCAGNSAGKAKRGLPVTRIRRGRRGEEAGQKVIVFTMEGVDVVGGRGFSSGG